MKENNRAIWKKKINKKLILTTLPDAAHSDPKDFLMTDFYEIVLVAAAFKGRLL